MTPNICKKRHFVWGIFFHAAFVYTLKDLGRQQSKAFSFVMQLYSLQAEFPKKTGYFFS
jgi:uncharacterized membrane protein